MDGASERPYTTRGMPPPASRPPSPRLAVRHGAGTDRSMDRVHHGAGADPEDSHTSRRTARTSARLARPRPAHRLGRDCASPRRPGQLLRSEWFDPPFDVRHVVHVTMMPGSVSAWHCHLRRCDVILPVLGQFRLAFYDDREDSPAYRTSLVVDAGIVRPTYFVVPTGVWHAILAFSRLRTSGSKDAGSCRPSPLRRMSPPQVGHASGSSSPTRAVSLAQAIRDVSCERGF